jgi:hypothetical protein
LGESATSVILRNKNQGWDDPDAAVFAAKGSHVLEIKWESNRSIIIRCDDCSRESLVTVEIIDGDQDIQYILPQVSKAYLLLSAEK